MRMTEQEFIEEGHGLLDVSCEHGSRWMWWPGPDGKGEWMNVVSALGCTCGEPPRSYKTIKNGGDVA